jgi:predicted dehydrogenase
VTKGTKPLGIGFVGAGMVGQVAHISNFVDLPGCRIVALAELRPQLGRLAAARFGIPRVYASHHDLLGDKEVDAVVVVTRPQAQGPIVLDVLESGRHVLSEKPMAHTVEQAQRLVQAADRRNLRYAVGFMKRHDAGAQQTKALLEGLLASGDLGKVLLLRAWCYGGEFRCGTSDFVMTDEVRPAGLTTWPIAPDWVPEQSKPDYASFLNVFLHDLNIMRYLAGSEPRVRAVDLSRPNGRLVMLDFGDFPAILEMAEVASHDWQEGAEVLFEKGRLTLRFASPMLRNIPASVELTRADGRNETIAGRAPWSWAFKRQAEAFIAAIALEKEPLASGRDSIEDLRLAEEVWRTHVHQPRSGQ